jgi:hypothetical protein
MAVISIEKLSKGAFFAGKFSFSRLIKLRRMQLDIFNDSRDVMLRNDVAQALLAGDAIAARAAWQRLQHEYAADDTLAASALLVDLLSRPQGRAFAAHAEAAIACAEFQDQAAPAAQRILGASAAAPWLQAGWRRLAERCVALPFLPAPSTCGKAWSELHAAPVWLHAGDGERAAEAVARIESWRRIPAPLGWMAQAIFQRQGATGLDAAWPLLAELAWLAPARFDAVCRALNDPLLNRLRQGFEDHFEDAGAVVALAWFPAWVLVDRPALAGVMRAAQPGQQSPPERAFHLMLELLGLERQGRQHELIDGRKQLRALKPALFQSYIQSR